MRRYTRLLFVLPLAVLAITLTGIGQSPVSPYPGGSPFPPGKEPSLTHVVKVYWTTVGGVATRIDVVTPGERPSQVEIVALGEKDAKPKHIHGFITPDGTHHVWIASQKPQTREERVGCIIAKGSGTATFRIFGWSQKDFDTSPVVTVRYLKDGQLVGHTSVEAKPIDRKLKARLAAARKEVMAGYRGDVKMPNGLLIAYAKFVSGAKQGRVDKSLYLPHSLTLTREPRSEKSREYGQDVNIPFLRKHFDGRVQVLRKDGEGCYLIRTSTTGLQFVKTGSMGWRLYRYLDKPIK